MAKRGRPAGVPDDGFEARGRALYERLTAGREFDPAGLVLVEEACRIADRLERLHLLLRGDAKAWAELRVDTLDERVAVLVVGSALTEARQQANALRQIVATLGLAKSEGATGAEDELDAIRRRRADPA